MTVRNIWLFFFFVTKRVKQWTHLLFIVLFLSSSFENSREFTGETLEGPWDYVNVVEDRLRTINSTCKCQSVRSTLRNDRLSKSTRTVEYFLVLGNTLKKRTVAEFFFFHSAISIFRLRNVSGPTESFSLRVICRKRNFFWIASKTHMNEVQQIVVKSQNFVEQQCATNSECWSLILDESLFQVDRPYQVIFHTFPCSTSYIVTFSLFSYRNEITKCANGTFDRSYYFISLDKWIST